MNGHESMTVLTEYRLRCDYCKVKSPVVLNWPDGGDYEKLPGWVRWVSPVLFSEPKHFCCEDHKREYEVVMGHAFSRNYYHPPRPMPRRLHQAGIDHD